MVKLLPLVVIGIVAIALAYVLTPVIGQPPNPEPSCDSGYMFDGQKCVWINPPDPQCPTNMHFDNALGWCVPNTVDPTCPPNHLFQAPDKCISLLLAKSMTISTSSNSATAGSPLTVTFTFYNIQNNALVNYQANIAPVVNGGSSNQYISVTTGSNAQATAQHTFTSSGIYLLQYKTNTGIISNTVTIAVSGGISCNPDQHVENGVCVPNDNDRLRNSALFKPERSQTGVHQATFDIYKDVLTSEDIIGTYNPTDQWTNKANWNFVKSLSTQTGAEIWIGYEEFLRQGGTYAGLQNAYPGTKWIMYDIEYPVPAGAATNTEITTAANKVHGAGLKFIPNLGSYANDNESNIKKAAQLGDLLIIQVMGHQESPTIFKNFVMKTVGWAKSANPNIEIHLGTSVSLREQNNHWREPNYVYSLLNSLPAGTIMGVHTFYGYVTATTNETRMSDLPRLDQMMDLLY